MKREKISMKWKVFVYLLMFAALLLVILWLFQIVYLDTFYKQIKRHELGNAMQNLIAGVGTEDYEEAVQTIARSYDISVMVFDKDGTVLYSSNDIPLKFRHEEEFESWYQKAQDNGGEYVENRSWQPGQPRPDDAMEDMSDIPQSPRDWFLNMPGMPKQNIEETVTWVRIISDKKNGEWLYLLESVITPVDATVHTLRIQLICISVIMLVLSLLIAWILSKSITRSIVRLNTAARELAKANYDVTFDAGDYKEIAELSQTLNYATGELGKTERFQRELLANVSHDLRTPLTMITAYAEMMRDLPGEDTPENVQVIIDEAKRLTALVNDMLDISRLQAGVMTLSVRTYSLTKSIEEVVGRLSRLLEPEGYHIIFQYSEEVFVKADEEKLHQVIYNLLGNAVNYTGSDKSVTIKQLCADNTVRIEVTDTGEGIPEESLAYVWERYYKVDRNHKRSVTGTGLGLSIVKNILKLHKAEYGAYSKEGSGSTFWFELEQEKITNLL